jgi:hypothetical protein
MSDQARPTWETVLFIFYGAIGLVLGGGAALVFGTLAIADYLKNDPQAGFFGVWSGMTFAVIALAGLPALVLAVRSLWVKQPDPPRSPPRAWIYAIAVYPAGLALGHWIFVDHGGPLLFGTLAQVMALGGPILAMAVAVQVSGRSVSALRAWTHFLLGLWLIPSIAFVVELIVLIFGLFFVVGGLMLSPTGQQLLNQMQGPPGRLFSQPPPELVTQAISQPWVIALAVLFVSVLIPIVEEGLKSIAVWPILPRSPSPSQAFVGGALGGFGFATVEGMFLTQPDVTWFSTAFIRGGASLMHALAAGIMAWGLAEAAVRRRGWRLPLAYAVAIALHGLWNLSAVGLGVSQLGSELGLSSLAPSVQTLLASVGATMLSALSLVALIGLPLIARSLARRNQTGDPNHPPEGDALVS